MSLDWAERGFPPCSLYAEVCNCQRIGLLLRIPECPHHPRCKGVGHPVPQGQGPPFFFEPGEGPPALSSEVEVQVLPESQASDPHMESVASAGQVDQASSFPLEVPETSAPRLAPGPVGRCRTHGAPTGGLSERGRRRRRVALSSTGVPAPLGPSGTAWRGPLYWPRVCSPRFHQLCSCVGPAPSSKLGDHLLELGLHGGDELRVPQVG